jgi:hypothetical protein
MKRNILTFVATAALCACGPLSAESDDVGQYHSQLLDSSAMVGNWSGTSSDQNGVSGDVTATFMQSSSNTFFGHMHAVFPSVGGYADCNLTGGTLATDGKVQMSSQCSFGGNTGFLGSVIKGQLSMDAQTLNTTFRGGAPDTGTIILTKIP